MKLIEDLNQSIINLEDDIRAIESLKEVAARLSSILEKYPQIRAWYVNHFLNLDITDPEHHTTVAILRDLAKAGFKKLSHDVFPDSKVIIYKFKEKIQLWTYFTNNEVGTSCRFVKVGVEEKPIYEYKCD